MPAPRGAGMSLTVTDPHLPVTCIADIIHRHFNTHRAEMSLITTPGSPENARMIFHSRL
jgi:hypothetical protein